MRRALLVMALLCWVGNVSRGDDWSQWMGDKRDGIWNETGIIEKFPEGGPKIRWRVPIGPGYAGPAVVGDRLYVMDRGTDNPVLKDAYARTPMPGTERLICHDVKTGKQIWKYEYDCPYVNLSYPTGPRTTPVVRDGRVYCLGTMGHIFCLDAEKGTVIWQKNLSKEYKSGDAKRKDAPFPVWGHAASLLLDGKKLITLASGDGSAVVALDKDNGNEIWRSLTSEEVCYVPPTIVEAGGKRQLIIWLSETLNSIDPETGKPFWMQPYPENGLPQRPAVNISQPVVKDDILFVSSFYHGPLAVKLAKDKPESTILYRGKKVANPAKAEMLHALMSTPAVVGKHMYATGAMGEIQCVEIETGKRVWSDKTALGGKDALFGTVFFIRNGDRFFLFGDQGDLIIAKLTPEKYEEISRAHILKPTQFARGRDVVWSHPAFAGKCMFVRNDKEIVCVELGK